MKIGVMGLGFVGGATKKLLEQYHEVKGYDPLIEEYNNLNVLKDSEIIFLCVPTPPKVSGEIDLSYIRTALTQIKSLNINPFICIKSTIIPGTCDILEKEFGFKISHNPEFLREKYAYEDLINSDRVIIGGDINDVMNRVYKPIFPNIIYKYLTNKEAEMVKYVTNVFLASQVAFANEIYQICGVLDIDYERIKETIHLDNRLGRHIEVPGPDGKFGFGGKCLPKEVRAIRYHVREKGYEPTLINEIWRMNKQLRDDN